MGHELLSKNDHIQCQISYMRKKYIFFVRLNHYMLLKTSVWKLNSLLANFPMVWKLCLKILFLNLNLTVLHIQPLPHTGKRVCGVWPNEWGNTTFSQSSKSLNLLNKFKKKKCQTFFILSMFFFSKTLEKKPKTLLFSQWYMPFKNCNLVLH